MPTQEGFHPVSAVQVYAEVILPLALPRPYTYAVPEDLVPEVGFGKRVEVQFGQSKLYTALVIGLSAQPPESSKPKPIIAVVDDEPIITPVQLKLWQWIAEYYSCSLGEVMHAALPANLKLASETVITLSPLFNEDFSSLGDKEYLIAEALSIQSEITINDVRGILQQKSVYPLIRRMLDQHLIYLKEDLKAKYKPKTVACVRLLPPYAADPQSLHAAFDLCSKSSRQMEALLAYIQLSRKLEFVRRQDIYQAAQVDSTVLNALAKKEIFELYDREVSRMGSYEEETIEASSLSAQQQRALQDIREAWQHKNVLLLHGATGSGKTRIYIELIQEAIQRGEQVLYLLPEIALTTQIISRLEKIFGNQIAVYHSRLNNNERVELWNSVLAGKPIVLGARSALFLPFRKLSLIVVDEEHDNSYKQYEPNPRYNARDAAIYLAHLQGAKTMLGTATPSLESYANAQSGKYALVTMPERFGGLAMPKIVLADAKRELQERKLQSHFTSILLEELKAALERGEQAILFQNRRGYAPTYRCTVCDWHSECIHCDVSLTYHKFQNNLKCHYCGYTAQLPEACPACGSKQLSLKGFGTEKIEDEIKIYLPQARIGRMDFDTVRGKDAHAKIINDFEEGRIDILVGTQMVTKGLDFERVGVVGVLSADQLLQFPDFRAGERAFQLMLQVSGRAGRKHRQGKVIIQAFNTAHPVLSEVLDNDYARFYAREMLERKQFKYPPYYRLIRLSLKHKTPRVVNDAGRIFEKALKGRLGEWVMGPAVPYVSRIRGFYLLDFLVKTEPDTKKLRYAKESIQAAIDALQQTQGFSGVRVSVDVDPY
jgi:primosomal protein N' (replication factor Y) (superfamily II helicase)